MPHNSRLNQSDKENGQFYKPSDRIGVLIPFVNGPGTSLGPLRNVYVSFNLISLRLSFEPLGMIDLFVELATQLSQVSYLHDIPLYPRGVKMQEIFSTFAAKTKSRKFQAILVLSKSFLND